MLGRAKKIDVSPSQCKFLICGKVIPVVDRILTQESITLIIDKILKIGQNDRNLEKRLKLMRQNKTWRNQVFFVIAKESGTETGESSRPSGRPSTESVPLADIISLV